jgi:hypothetical protein
MGQGREGVGGEVVLLQIRTPPALFTRHNRISATRSERLPERPHTLGRAMSGTIRVNLEIGPKGKRVVAYSPDWPGFNRGAKTEEAALETLHAYLPRYAPIAELAGLAADFPAPADLALAERYTGTGSTDFWGISFAFSAFDHEPMSAEELERQLALLRAAWAYFDQVRARVSPELRKGPRGGGRDRDRIVRHTLACEQQGWPGKIGLASLEQVTVEADAVAAHRDAYVAAIRAHHAEGKPARNWPLRYLIRHTAFHTLDHTWEMEDKDLTNERESGVRHLASAMSRQLSAISM